MTSRLSRNKTLHHTCSIDPKVLQCSTSNATSAVTSMRKRVFNICGFLLQCALGVAVYLKNIYNAQLLPFSEPDFYVQLLLICTDNFKVHKCSNSKSSSWSIYTMNRTVTFTKPLNITLSFYHKQTRPPLQRGLAASAGLCTALADLISKDIAR